MVEPNIHPNDLFRETLSSRTDLMADTSMYALRYDYTNDSSTMTLTINQGKNSLTSSLLPAS